MKPAMIARALVMLFFISYPFIVYFGISILPPSFFGLVLVVLLAFRFGVLLPEERSALLPILLVFLGYAIATVIFDSARLLLFYPAMVNFTFFLVFANSLRGGEPLLLRIVRARGVAMSEHTPRYLYWLTMLWAVFFILNGMVSIWTSTLSMQAWTLYNGLISYFIVAILGAGEWLFRRYYKKRVGVRTS
ncbi:MAG: hypothetical protein WBS20_04210 [Lysobacterales bacterium]